eukprot:CAMPEP_0198688454 /NCGR_PEP_ID=MMETSP1468-20131203/105321_1 /TAXON_ID=1461545 /ORGANISM="Mantoniella sp, Strain CCMP1436" /LENGTH=90 /DNA_ID=CAMNT_0044438093 /DNA_START=37 /DNA_END=306 /DNA_ORIENTATION=-
MNKLQIQLKKKEKERKEGAGKKGGSSKEGKAKEAQAASAHVCQSCRQPFMVTAKAKALQEHADAKHPKLRHEECFPELAEMMDAEAAAAA